MLRPRMFILSTGETREPSKEIGKLEGALEKEICRSWVFKELNFTRLRRPHPESESYRAIVRRIRAATFFRNRLDMSVLPTLRESVSICLLYTSDAADERSSVDLGG